MHACYHLTDGAAAAWPRINCLDGQAGHRMVQDIMLCEPLLLFQINCISLVFLTMILCMLAESCFITYVIARQSSGRRCRRARRARRDDCAATRYVWDLPWNGRSYRDYRARDMVDIGGLDIEEGSGESE